MKVETGISAKPEAMVERPWKQNLAAASESFRQARDLFNDVLSEVSDTGRANVNKMLRTLVPLSLTASYLLSACSGADQQTPTVISTGEGDTGPTPTLVAPIETVTELPTEAPIEQPTPDPNNLASKVEKYLKDIDSKELGPAIAKSLYDQGVVLANEAELLRKNGINIATSAMPDATFYIAPSQNPNGDILSMGFRPDTDADWTTTYAAIGPNGPWFQLVQIKYEKDANGNSTNNISIIPLFQYGSRGDGFDINHAVRP